MAAFSASEQRFPKEQSLSVPVPVPADEPDQLAIEQIEQQQQQQEEENEEADSLEYHEPLWLRGAHDAAGSLQSALESQRVVDNLEICVNGSFTDSPDAALSLFLRATGLLGLQSLRIFPEMNAVSYPLPIHLLTVALRQATQLNILSVCGMQLTGRWEDFGRFQKALRNHNNSLSSFRLIRCSLLLLPTTTKNKNNNNDQEGTIFSNNQHQHNLLNSIVESLSNIPQLTDLELTSAEEDQQQDDSISSSSTSSLLGTLSNTSLHRLITDYSQTTRLQRIRLDNFNFFVEEQLILLLQALEANTCLKSVGFSYAKCTEVGFRGLARMLVNNQSLQELSLGISFNHTVSISSNATATSNTITEGEEEERNDTQQEQQDTQTIITEEVLLEVVQALQHQTTLKQFRLTTASESLLDKHLKQSLCNIQDDLLHALRHNYTLEDLFLLERMMINDADQNFYLALNRMGRKQIAEENATRQDLVKVLVHAQVNLDCLYYFLSMRPQLFANDNSML